MHGMGLLMLVISIALIVGSIVDTTNPPGPIFVICAMITGMISLPVFIYPTIKTRAIVKREDVIFADGTESVIARDESGKESIIHVNRDVDIDKPVIKIIGGREIAFTMVRNIKMRVCFACGKIITLKCFMIWNLDKTRESIDATWQDDGTGIACAACKKRHGMDARGKKVSRGKHDAPPIKSRWNGIISGGIAIPYPNDPSIKIA